MVYITLTHILKGIIEFYHGVYHTNTHILKGIIEFNHSVYHTHTHPKWYNKNSIIPLRMCVSVIYTMIELYYTS
jgi:hypothetical protein